jgi:hypothetical protein
MAAAEDAAAASPGTAAAAGSTPLWVVAHDFMTATLGVKFLPVRQRLCPAPA